MAVMRHTMASQEALDYGPVDLLEVVDAGPCVVAFSASMREAELAASR
jgi:hypothetical protein